MKSRTTYKNLPYKKVYLYRFIGLILSIDFILILVLSSVSKTDALFKTIFVLLVWSLIFYMIPLLVLYFNYSRANKNSVLKLENDSIIFKKAPNAEQVEFKLTDIDYVELNLSLPLYENRWRLFFWDEYYYSYVVLKNGDSLVITCLLFDNLESLLPLNLIKKRKRFFPLVKYKSTLNEIQFSKLDDNVEFNKKVQKFMVKYKNKSKLELQDIIDGEYISEATLAAKKLIKLMESET